MTDKEKLDKLVAEIERRYNEYMAKDLELAAIRADECLDILSFIDSMQEEPQVKESAKIQHVNKTCKENGKSLTQEPVSEDLEEAGKEWLKPQLDKSYANYGEVKMMELTHFDGYAMLDAIEFGANWQEQKDSIPVSEDLKQQINAEWNCYSKDGQFGCINRFSFELIARHFANWQKKKDDYAIEIAHMAGEEEGKNIMKQQMMAKAVDGVVHRFNGCGVVSVHYNDPNGIPMAYFIPSEGLSAGDKVKIITIKKG